jgi:hypothetical protein
MTAIERETWDRLALLDVMLRRKVARQRMRSDPAKLEAYRVRNALEQQQLRARLARPCWDCGKNQAPCALEPRQRAGVARMVCRSVPACVRRCAALVRAASTTAPAVDATDETP